MTGYTKVTIKKEVYEKLKVMAAADNRSVANFLENLILKEENQ
jgi:predicted CopG family antitoxin